MGSHPSGPNAAVRKEDVVGSSSAPQPIANSSGNLYGFICDNLDAAAMYLVFFDKATTPVPGTDQVKIAFKISALGTFGRDPNPIPLDYFSTKCWVKASTTRDGVGALGTDPDCVVWFEAKGA